MGLCPYSAIEFDERRHEAVVNEAIARAAGSCAGYCPSGPPRSGTSRKGVFAELKPFRPLREKRPPSGHLWIGQAKQERNANPPHGG